MLRITVFIAILVAPSWGMHRCDLRLIQANARMADWYDLYNDASTFDVQTLVGTRWKLMGVASRSNSPLGLRSEYSETGYSVNDRIPHLRFLDRDAVQRDPENAPLLGLTERSVFVERETWGTAVWHAPFETVGTAMWPRIPSVLKDATTFYFPLFDWDGPELFQSRSGDRPVTGGRLYFYCRSMDPDTLLCLGQYQDRRAWRADPLAPLPITAIFWLAK